MKCLITIATIFLLLHKIKGENNDYYTAAILEYSPVENGSIDEKINNNVANYVKLIRDVKERLDIIIYPEATLTVFLYNDSFINYTVFVNVNSTPCNNSNSVGPQYLKTISCLAKEKQSYLVLNINEKEQCEKNQQCAKNGFNVYNTDVVFDRNGTIITKYRKFNLFGETFTNRTKEVELVTFTTDFNVTFGVFTCFDVLFNTPALELVRRNIKHFVFPTLWFAELPFLTATQAQQMWAEENNVVLLASNANANSDGSGGSGIYAGKNGPLVMEVTSNVTRQVYIANISKYDFANITEGRTIENESYIDELGTNMDNFHLKVDDSIKDLNSVILSTAKNITRETVCHVNFCCNFDIEINVNNNTVPGSNNYTYHLVAFSGVRSFSGVYNGGIQICGVIACLNSSKQSCGLRFPVYKDITWPVTFTKINIEGNFTNSLSYKQFPNSLLSSIRPIHPNETEWITKQLDNNNIQRTYVLKKQQNRLLTFAIYGRDFSQDHENDDSGSNAIYYVNKTVCTMMSIYVLMNLVYLN